MAEQSASFGEELRRLRKAKGLSEATLAARIHYSKGYLSRIENGKVKANPGFAEACDAALGAEGALMALVTRAIRHGRSRPATGISGLPAVTRHFVGRHAEAERVRAVLSGQGLGPVVCVLTGMAGVGKTTLALHCAWGVEAQFPDGCLFFDLRSHTTESVEASSAETLDRLLRMLGVPGEGIPSDLDGRANLYRHRLRGKRMLLVYDNVGSVAQATPLLPAESMCRVLLTSRNRLNALDDAVHVAVDVLSTDESVRLFRSVAGGQVPQADEPVERVVEHCGKLPLAVRIAAARIGSGPLSTFGEVAERLADEAARLDVLDDGERSMMAAFNLSYRSLTRDQRQLFGLLALHPGGSIEVPAAAALAGLPLRTTERLLIGLSDAHLIMQRVPGYAELHELVRVFALEQALGPIPPGDRESALGRLLDYSLFRAEASSEFIARHRYRPRLAFQHLPEVAKGFPDRRRALAWIEANWPTLVALCTVAAAQGMHERCWQLAFVLRDFFFLVKLWDPWIDTHRQAAEVTRAAGNRRALAITLNNLGMAHADRGDLHDALACYEEALALFRETADEHGTSALCNVAWVNLYLGNPAAALRGLGTGLMAYRGAGERRKAAITLRGIALAETELGLLDDALRHAEQALAESRELGLELDYVMSLNCVAWVHYRAGRYPNAESCYAQAAEKGELCESRYEVARAKTGMGNVRASTGGHAVAEDLWAQASELYTRLNPRIVGEARARVQLCDSGRQVRRQPERWGSEQSAQQVEDDNEN
jgi:tetratricopeptide (TPR) repeat protein